jgi:hypothetical protein
MFGLKKHREGLLYAGMCLWQPFMQSQRIGNSGGLHQSLSEQYFNGQADMPPSFVLTPQMHISPNQKPSMKTLYCPLLTPQMHRVTLKNKYLADVEKAREDIFADYEGQLQQLR